MFSLKRFFNLFFFDFVYDKKLYFDFVISIFLALTVFHIFLGIFGVTDLLAFLFLQGDFLLYFGDLFYLIYVCRMFDHYELIYDLHEDVFYLFLSVSTLDRYLFGLIKFFVDKYLFKIKNYFSDFNKGYYLFNFIFILFAGFIYSYEYFVLKSLGDLNIKACLSILLELISFFCNAILFIIGIFSCCIFIITRVNGDYCLFMKKVIIDFHS